MKQQLMKELWSITPENQRNAYLNDENVKSKIYEDYKYSFFEFEYFILLKYS